MVFESTNEPEHPTDNINGASAPRRFLSQFVATTVKNLLIFDNSLCYAFSGIIIPALTGIQNEHNLNETLTMTPVQASWFGSIPYIFQPLGSILSSLITDSLGRKRAMIAANVPYIIAWPMMYNANDVWQIYVAYSLMGFANGLSQSPCITYISEISEPSNRGIMIASASVAMTLGMFFVFLLNTLMPWRSVALISVFVPISAVIGLCCVPETPLWLLSKNRHSEAKKALSWLRGWVSTDAVTNEFQELQRYSQRYKSCNSCLTNDLICIHPLPTLLEKCAELKRKSTLKPLFILLLLCFFADFSGMTGMMPFMVQIFKAYDSPIAPDKAVAVASFLSVLANLLLLCLVRFTGKRPIYLISLSMTFLSTAVIAVYGFMILPSGYNSFDHSQIFSLVKKQLAYIPFLCIILWKFLYNFGVHSIPFQILGELFPSKVRGIVTGLIIAVDFLLRFVAIKTYYDLETSLSMPGFAVLNCFITGFGVILMYKIMPSVDNRSLEEIEMHFSDKSKKITDWKVARISFQDKKTSTGDQSLSDT